MNRLGWAFVVLAMLLLVAFGLQFLTGAPAPRLAVTDPVHDGAVPAVAADPARHGDVLEREPLGAAQPPLDSAVGAPGPEELWGRVIARSSKAGIAGAEVQLLLSEGDQFWNLDLDYGHKIAVLATVRTEADGRFRFPLARARLHRLHAAAPGYAAVTVVACTGGSEVTIELCGGASLDGVVRCEGKPMVDTPLRVAVAGQSVELANGRTDAGGSFSFTGLPPARVYVQVLSPQHVEKWQLVELLPDGVHHVDIDVAAGVALRGCVIDATTRTPIAAAEITDSWTFKRVVRSDADGRFVLPGLHDEGFVEINVRAPGYATLSANVTGALSKEAEFALVSGGEVSGRFVFADGKPASSVYAAVAASFMQGPGMGGTDWIRAQVGNDGRFLATGLRPDQHYWLYARGTGLGARQYALPRRLGAHERCDLGDLLLRAAGGIEGRVVDDKGEPWSNVGVSIRGTNTDCRSLVSADQAPSEVYQFNSRDVRTDARGCFRGTDVAAGSYELRAEIRGRDSTATVTVEVSDGVIRGDVEIVVPRGLAITGTLRYSDGRALGEEAAALHLSATNEKGEHVGTQLGPGGRFELLGLPAGPCTLTLARGPKGWSMSPQTGIAAGSKDVRLLLQPSSFLRGRVVDADGKPVKARVYASPDGSRSGSAQFTTDDDGRFEIEVPADFHGSVGAMHTQQQFLQAKIDDVSAGRSDLELQLRSPR